MVLTPSILDSIFFNVMAGWQVAYDTTPTFWDKVATMMPSSTRSNRYAWVAQMPRLRQWLGERKVNNLSARGYSIDNLDFEDTLALDQNDVEDDNLGIFSANISQLAEKSKKWPDDRITVAIQSGVTALCYDGQPFFNDSHPINTDRPSDGTFSNNYVNMPLNSDNFNTVRQNMQLVQAEDLKPMGIMPNLLVVPPQLEMKAKQILQASINAPAAGFGINSPNSQENVLKGVADVLVIPELGNDPDGWYLMKTNGAIKPFAWQLRKAPNLVALTAPTDAKVFEERKLVWGVHARGNHGYTFPFLAVRATAAAS